MDKLVQNLEKNGFTVTLCKSKDDARENVLRFLSPATSISRGGSVTLDECGIIGAIEEQGLPFFDYDTMENKLKSLTCDYYLTSTNALIEDGTLYNIDGRGNRVAAISFGPNKVVVVVGKNKIVKNMDEAIQRLETIAAPMNARRLDRKVPCAVTNKCSDCNSPDRICMSYVHTRKSAPNRIHIFLVDEALGY